MLRKSAKKTAARIGVRSTMRFPDEPFIWSVTYDGMLPRHKEEFLNDLILSPGVCLVDAGANVGAWSIRASKYYDSVHAFEPNKKFFSSLERNIALNHLDNIHAYNLALGEIDGITTQRVIYNEQMAKTTGIMDDAKVQTRRLDSLSLEPSIIKIDVEGAAIQVIRGALSTISAHRPKIIIETHTTDERLEGGLLGKMLPEYHWVERYREYPETAHSRQLFLVGRSDPSTD